MVRRRLVADGLFFNWLLRWSMISNVDLVVQIAIPARCS